MNTSVHIKGSLVYVKWPVSQRVLLSSDEIVFLLSLLLSPVM